VARDPGVDPDRQGPTSYQFNVAELKLSPTFSIADGILFFDRGLRYNS